MAYRQRETSKKRCVDERKLNSMMSSLKNSIDELIEEDAKGNEAHKILLQQLADGIIEPCVRGKIELKCNMAPSMNCIDNILQLIYTLWITPIEQGGWGTNFPDNIFIPGKTFYNLLFELLMPVDRTFSYKSLHYLLLRDIVLNMNYYREKYNTLFLQQLLMMILEENSITGIYAVPPKKTMEKQRTAANFRDLKEDKEAHDEIMKWINAVPARKQMYLDLQRGTPKTGVTISNTIVHDMLGNPIIYQGGKKKKQQTKRRLRKYKQKKVTRKSRKLKK